MTDRDELARLINPDAEAKHERHQTQGFISDWYQAKDAADRVIAAGWRPPVSGDVIEQAARTVQAAVEDRQFVFANEFYDAGHGGDYPPTRYNWDRLSDFEQDAWREGALHLANAGLLAATPVPGEGVEIPACPTCSGPIRETVGMVCQTCGTDYGSGKAEIPAQEFVSIPVPPDAETVELVAAAMAEAVYCDGTWLRLAAEKKADYRRYARAALHALTEVSDA